MAELFKLRPAFKDYIWGGNDMRERFGFDSPADRIAEAWVMSAHRDGPSVICGGEQDGRSLMDYVGEEGLPLLGKFIDAKDNLSIQVHPDEEYANRVEGEHGKNEMWYVLGAEPGAGLYVGFKQDVTKEEVRRRIEDGTITDVLNFVETRPGDSFYIPAGTVHAIAAGNLICEMQQSSNCTYRLYDYKRRDKDGNERELHVDKALDVMNLKKYVPYEPGEASGEGDLKVIVDSEYFTVSICEVEGRAQIPLDDAGFVSVICTRGSGSLSLDGAAVDVRAGDSVFVPAQKGVITAEGEMTLMVSNP